MRNIASHAATHQAPHQHPAMNPNSQLVLQSPTALQSLRVGPGTWERCQPTKPNMQLVRFGPRNASRVLPSASATWSNARRPASVDLLTSLPTELSLLPPCLCHAMGVHRRLLQRDNAKEVAATGPSTLHQQLPLTLKVRHPRCGSPQLGLLLQTLPRGFGVEFWPVMQLSSFMETSMDTLVVLPCVRNFSDIVFRGVGWCRLELADLFGWRD